MKYFYLGDKNLILILKLEFLNVLKNEGYISEYENEPVQKIDFSFQTELIADVFFARVPPSLHTVVAGGYYASLGRTGGEITANGVTKGSGIERVLQLFHGKKENAYGFGVKYIRLDRNYLKEDLLK